MNRPEKIDFFELSDKILERLNAEGGINLSHYDINLKFHRDVHYPSDKFNIYLLVFNEEYSKTYYTLDYNTTDKIINILFLHAADDYGYVNTRHGLITIKNQSLENSLRETIENCREIIHKKFHPKILSDLVIFVGEQFPYDHLDKNGFPFFELNIFSTLNNFDIRIPLDFNASDFSNKAEIIDKLKNKINGAEQGPAALA